MSVCNNNLTAKIPHTNGMIHNIQDLTKTCVIGHDFRQKTNMEDDEILTWLPWHALEL